MKDILTMIWIRSILGQSFSSRTWSLPADRDKQTVKHCNKVKEQIYVLAKEKFFDDDLNLKSVISLFFF